MVRSWFAGALVLALVPAACGGGGDGKAKTSTSTKGPTKLTASFRGVTADSVKIGIVIIDYSKIAFAVDFNRGDQQKIAQTFVDDINANGGILGRKIVPVYKTYNPITNVEPLKICTELTEDEKVFAVLGVFIDFSGDAQLCLARDKKTIHIGHELKRAWIDQAPEGLLLSPDITQERRIDVLMSLVRQKNTLKGKKVAILSDQDSQSVANDVIKPALDRLKLEQGSTGVLSIAGTDTSAAQGQLDSFIEKWKGEKIDALFLSSQNVAGGKQFVDKIKANLPNVLLLTDVTSGTYQAAQDAVSAGQKPNSYEGIISVDGLNASERWAKNPPLLKHCREVYEKATGQTIVGPDDLKPGPDGKRVEIYVAVSDFCGELVMFKAIAEKAGVNLTNDSWTKAVNNYGKIVLVTADIASLKKGKYDAEDGFRLQAFDSSIGNKGDWRPLTEIADAAA
jgi:ABC-type branched-subunit amino acid transport system substrate-binding protein